MPKYPPMRNAETGLGQATRLVHEARESRSQGDLAHSGLLDRAGEGHQRRARLARRSQLAEPVTAIPSDQRHLCKRLDIQYECRRSTDSALERTRWDE